jgi:hypothetical protein
MHGEPTQLQSRDEQKRLAANDANITLIEIPYWWDLSKDSLKATIHKYRSDLFTDIGKVT